MRLFTFLILSAFLIATAGCGYTSSSLLPPDTDSIHVANFANEIEPTRQVSDKNVTYFYFPGMETNITRSVIDRFILDSHLDIKAEKDADLVLKGSLTDLDRYPLSYSKDENVEEFRIEIIVDLSLLNNRTGKVMWQETGFSGQTDYDISGKNAINEAEAVNNAIKDLAQRIVERTVEAW